MICSFCQKFINGKEVRVKRGFLRLERVKEKYAYSPAFYHRKCYLVISGKRKKEQKRYLILIFFVIVIFTLIIVFLTYSWK